MSRKKYFNVKLKLSLKPLLFYAKRKEISIDAVIAYIVKASILSEKCGE